MFSVNVGDSSELEGLGLEHHRTSEIWKGYLFNVREFEGILEEK
jgi:hypothetical protein